MNKSFNPSVEYVVLVFRAITPSPPFHFNGKRISTNACSSATNVVLIPPLFFFSYTFDEMDGGFQNLSSDSIHNNIDPLRRCCDRYIYKIVMYYSNYRATPLF